MAGRTLKLTDDVMERLERLMGNPYRPKEIRTLEAEIAEEKRVAEVRSSISGEIDQGAIERITAMKLRLDGLYADWIQGNIE